MFDARIREAATSGASSVRPIPYERNASVYASSEASLRHSKAALDYFGLDHVESSPPSPGRVAPV